MSTINGKTLDRLMSLHRWFVAKQIPDYDEIYEVFDEIPALVSRVRELEAEWRTKYLRLAKRHIKLRFESKRLRAEVRELEARLEAVRDRLDELITDMHSESNRRVSSDIWGTELEDCKALLDTPAKEDQ